MPFNRSGGRPRHLFKFQIQSLVLCYAASQTDIPIGTDTYLAAAIERTEVKETAEKPQDQITITVPYNRNPAAPSNPVTQPLGDLWHPYIPSDTVRVVCMTWDAAQPDAAPDVDWIGVVAQPKFSDGKLELTCIPGSMIDRARYQGPKWSVNSWKNIYSQGPRGGNLIAEAIPVTGTVTEVGGNDVTAAEFTPPQRTFVGGVATWDDDGTPRTANITAATGTTLTLDDVTGIAVGTAVTAYTTAISLDGAITAIDGLQVTVPEFAGSVFPLLGGDVQWTRANGVIERRSILGVDPTGKIITLHYAGPDLAIGTALHARPGCDNSWDAWAARGRSIDYGGSVYMPVASPYDGQSMSWG